MQMDEFRATETERFILNALLQGCGSINQLGRKTREKIKRLLDFYVSCVEISSKDYAAILAQLRAYTNGTSNQQATDADQPPMVPQPPPAPDWVNEADAADDYDQLPL